jgi:hypothetical protein
MKFSTSNIKLFLVHSYYTKKSDVTEPLIFCSKRRESSSASSQFEQFPRAAAFAKGSGFRELDGHLTGSCERKNHNTPAKHMFHSVSC